VAQSVRRSERIRIPRAGIFQDSSGEFVFIAQHKKRTKIVATRHEMLLRPGVRPEPR